MTQPIPPETIEYERYVDGLRRSNADLLEFAKRALQIAISRKTTLHLACACIEGMSLPDNIEFPEWVHDGMDLLTRTNGAAQTTPPKPITVHVEGRLVQDVTGIPAGYEVRVEDRDDDGDTSHPSWDEEKGCFVAVYGGDEV